MKHLDEEDILSKAISRSRISNKEALYLWRFTDFRKLGLVADQIRKNILPPKKVTYTVFRVINYTNYCNVECSFCSFMDEVGSNKGYVLSVDQILKKVEESYKKDIKQIFLQGGVNPELPFSYYTRVLEKIKKSFPEVHIRAFSPVEVLFMEKLTGLKLESVFKELIHAGMDSFTGAGAEILTERMRNILSPKKTTTREWIRGMETAGLTKLKSSTNIVWGSEESDEEIISHLDKIRSLQDKTGEILSFIPWVFQKQTKRFKVRYVPSTEYLKMVALARIYLDNILHIETSILAMGKHLGELALNFGADDINSPVIEENVLRSFGLKSIQEAENFIRKVNFIPERRNFNYQLGKKS